MDRREIEEVIQNYFDASFEGNGAKMRAVFHPEAHIYGLDADGKLTDWPSGFFAEMIDHPPKPRPDGWKREEMIYSIDFTGTDAAVARVGLLVDSNFYTDILSFLRIDGRWGVIAKVLSGVKRQ